LPVFSLPSLIAPILGKENREAHPVTLIITEMGSQTGWLSDKLRAEHSRSVREVLQRCLHSDLDILLPKMGLAAAAELFFIVAMTDGIGADAITTRIREKLAAIEPLQQGALTFATSCRSLGAVKRTPGDSLESFLESVAAKIQETMNEETSMRTVEHG
jgi:hypothetical protein